MDDLTEQAASAVKELLGVLTVAVQDGAQPSHIAALADAVTAAKDVLRLAWIVAPTRRPTPWTDAMTDAVLEKLIPNDAGASGRTC